MELAANQQTVDQALDWHAAIEDSVAIHRATVFAEFRSGTLTPIGRFFLMNYDEIGEFFAAETAEVEGYAIVSILAAAEAAIRDDYRDRVDGRFKDALSKAYIEFHRTLDGLAVLRPPFDHQGILTSMRQSGAVPAHLIAAFRDVLRLRHWHAHGRYWTVALGGNSYMPADVHAVCQQLLAALPP